MIRVLQIGMSSNYGGIENFVFNCYEHIDKNKFQFDFIDIYGSGLAYQDKIDELGAKTYSLINYKQYPIKMIKQLLSILQHNKYDIVHIHLLSAANFWLVVLLKCVKKTKIIVHSHSSAIPSGMIRYMANTIGVLVLRKLDIIKWACGFNAGTWMWGEFFEKENIITNAIDVSKFKSNEKQRGILRKENGYSDTDFIVGFIGTFTEAKNIFFVADILYQLNKKNDKYKLLMIGDGPLKQALVDYCIQKGILEKVNMVGVQHNTCEWYQVMDCFILPSKFEGLPLVGIEAQAAQLPTFLSSNITKEIDLTKYVQYLSIEDAREWAHAIENLISLENVDLSRLRGFDIKYEIRKLEQKYEEC